MLKDFTLVGRPHNGFLGLLIQSDYYFDPDGFLRVVNVSSGRSPVEFRTQSDGRIRNAGPVKFRLPAGKFVALVMFDGHNNALWGNELPSPIEGVSGNEVTFMPGAVMLTPHAFNLISEFTFIIHEEVWFDDLATKSDKLTS